VSFLHFFPYPQKDSLPIDMSASAQSKQKPTVAERRPSVVERRYSQSISDRRRGSIIPELAGLEKPLETNIASEFDVVIVGTGLVEGILAAALAWQGSSVLHVDSNAYYGDNCATLTIDQLKVWVDQVNDHKIPGFSTASLYIPRPNVIVSRNYGIDLTPKILFAKSDLLDLLIKSRVHRYLEFQPLSNFHTYEDDSFGKMQTSKQEIFTDQSLSLISKKRLMKFLKFVFEFDQNEESLSVWTSYADKPLTEFTNETFKLESQQISELVFTLGLAPIPNIPTKEGLSRIRRYLTSFNIYGKFPVLYSKFGGPGEVSQGFCRSAAVAGTTYKLNTRLRKFDPNTKTATFSDGSQIKVKEKLICSPTQAPENAKNIPLKRNYAITRLIAGVTKDCKEWFSEGESAAIVVFPANCLPTNNAYPVQAVILGAGAGVCPEGQCLWYLSTLAPEESAGKDLEAALNKMEESILRESEFDVDESEFQFDDKGVPVLNSVKLGKSFMGFVPSKKLQYVFKLRFVQFTDVVPFGVVHKEYFDTESPSSKYDPDAPDNGIFYSNMPSSELSYDGAVTEATLLYSKIVGADDDFFDVDFEDEDEVAAEREAAGNATSTTTSNSLPTSRPEFRGTSVGSEFAIVDEEDDDDEEMGDAGEKFNDEMDFVL